MTTSLASPPSRLLFNEDLNRALIQAKRHDKLLALLFIELDDFQKIKDALGIEQTQALLEKLSQNFTAEIRAGDSLVHLEEDTFALLLAGLEQPKLAATVAKKILNVSHTFQLTVSIAICLFPEDGQTLEELEKRATATLCQAKNQGGNQYQFALPQRTTEAQDYLELQAALRQALRENEFILYYQPKLDLKTGSLAGLEALIRWNHPTLGLIDPLQFIPSAEETDLILEIGEWALREACHTNKTWQNEGYQPLIVAVNLSPKQFYNPELNTTIKQVLLESGLDPCYLELELTEMTVLDDIPKVTRILYQLHRLGLTVALDDFGTGHTSISYLKNFPLNTVKIDQSFIKSLPENASNAAITTAIITLAHHLGIQVVAEGVETLEQLNFLKKLHCDQVQGYFISPPLPASKIVVQMKKKF